jgi:hypothetical protein
VNLPAPIPIVGMFIDCVIFLRGLLEPSQGQGRRRLIFHIFCMLIKISDSLFPSRQFLECLFGEDSLNEPSPDIIFYKITDNIWFSSGFTASAPALINFFAFFRAEDFVHKIRMKGLRPINDLCALPYCL